ncbi:MAG: glutaredoxin domain-containing protein [Parcubacteria group bacterium]
MIVKIYSTPACPYCHTLKEFFKEKGIQFEEIDVSEDEKVKDDMIKRSGQMGVPVVEIDGQMIIGFDREKILNLLGIQE